MAIYRTVSMSFWTDSKVLDDFTPEDKYFYLYLFTNPHTNLSGCYEISFKQMIIETGYSRETLENLINRFETIHRVLRYSPETKELLLINWHKYNWTSSEKFRKPLLNELYQIKDASFADYLLSIFYENDEKREIYPIDTNCIDTSVTVSDTDTVTDTVSNNSKKSKRFVPPTVDEVQAYIDEKGYSVDAESFVEFYKSKGWMVGKTKMVSWKSSVATWEIREKKERKNERKEMDLSVEALFGKEQDNDKRGDRTNYPADKQLIHHANETADRRRSASDG